MKNILYIVAIVASLAGAWFSYDFKSEFETLRTQREELDGKNENRKASIKALRKEYKQIIPRIKLVKTMLSDANAGVDNAKSKLNLTKEEVSQWKGKIAATQVKLDESEKYIQKVKAMFSESEGDVSIEEIPALVQKLEDDVKEINKKLEEMQTLVEAANSRVVSDDELIKDLETRLSKRAANIRGNASRGRITAVNHDWGFVTVEVPGSMKIAPSTKLMVMRGGSYIGNLKINSIEGRRVVADIDYRSMKSGMVVQSGDFVIRVKPATN